MRKVLLPVCLLVGLAAAAAPSLAAPAQRFALPDESQQNLNVCTGNITTVALSDRILVIHEDVDQAGRTHQSGTLTGNISTADGFSGRFTVHFGASNLSEPVIVGEFSNTASFTLHDGHGALIMIHAVFHVTVPPASGGLRGSVDTVSAQCLGSPG